MKQLRPTLADRVRLLGRRGLPFLVWGLAVLLLVTLVERRRSGPLLRGIAEDISYSVAASTGGRIANVAVQLSQNVERGQVVAVLDDRELLLRLSGARSELERLRAEAARESLVEKRKGAERRVQADADLRRFSRDIEQAHIDCLEAEASQGEDRIRLQGLEVRLQRSEGLAVERLARAAQLDQDRTSRDALKARIGEREGIIEQMRARLTAAKRRYQAHVRSLPGDQVIAGALLRPLEHAVNVQEARLARIDHEIEQLVLRAPAAGIVARVLMHSGAVVRPGDAIVEINEPHPGKLVGWIPEEQPVEVAAGQKVLLSCDRGPAIESTIARVGTRIVELPERLWTDVRQPLWGTVIEVSLPRGLAARPGQAFAIHLVAP